VVVAQEVFHDAHSGIGLPFGIPCPRGLSTPCKIGECNGFSPKMIHKRFLPPTIETIPKVL